MEIPPDKVVRRKPRTETRGRRGPKRTPRRTAKNRKVLSQRMAEKRTVRPKRARPRTEISAQ